VFDLLAHTVVRPAGHRPLVHFLRLLLLLMEVGTREASTGGTARTLLPINDCF
jgi:hypothetical protein